MQSNISIFVIKQLCVCHIQFYTNNTKVTWFNGVHSLKYQFGLRHQVSKIKGLKNQSLLQELSSFRYLNLAWWPYVKWFSSSFFLLIMKCRHRIKPSTICLNFAWVTRPNRGNVLDLCLKYSVKYRLTFIEEFSF